MYCMTVLQTQGTYLVLHHHLYSKREIMPRVNESAFIITKNSLLSYTAAEGAATNGTSQSQDEERDSKLSKQLINKHNVSYYCYAAATKSATAAHQPSQSRDEETDGKLSKQLITKHIILSYYCYTAAAKDITAASQPSQSQLEETERGDGK